MELEDRWKKSKQVSNAVGKKTKAKRTRADMCHGVHSSSQSSPRTQWALHGNQSPGPYESQHSVLSIQNFILEAA